MRTKSKVGIASAILASLTVSIGVWAQSQLEPEATKGASPRVPRESSGYSTSEHYAGKWSSGAGLGILGSTPDDTALAINGNLDYFVNEQVSVGPLLQFGVTDDMTQVGLSGQGKYWIDLPGTGGRGKMALQSGLGFVHSDFRSADSSWLVPLGVGYEHAWESGRSLTASALVNFTNLHTGAGSGADVMPGFVFGMRF